MKSRNILDVLIQEQSVFRSFSNWRVLTENCIAFCAPDTDLVPHWNLVYPSATDYNFTRNDRFIIEEYFSSIGRVPHVLTFEDDQADCAVERVTYFVLPEHRLRSEDFDVQVAGTSFIARNNVNLGDFVQVVGDVFDLDQSTRLFFLEKMETMSHLEGSQFWIIYSEEQAVGTASTFVTEDGGRFLFNVAIGKDVQKRGLGKAMLTAVVNETQSPLYTYSHNPAMIEKILPALGFERIGSANVVPLSDYTLEG